MQVKLWVIGFSEDFTATTLNTAWNESGPGGSFDAAKYLLSLTYQRESFTEAATHEGGTIGSFHLHHNGQLCYFLIQASAQTLNGNSSGLTDSRRSSSTASGDMRMFHNVLTEVPGISNQNTNIGLTGAGDLLELTLQYDDVADQLEVTYSLNGGGSTPFYSGGGIDGRVGDLVTNFTQVEVFEFGGGAPVPVVQVQEWNLTPVDSIPEPSSSLLLDGCLGLFAIRRRR